MRRTEHDGFSFYTFGQLSGQEGILHFVSSGTDTVGFSEGIPAELVFRNRRKLAEAVGFDVRKLVTARQVHSARVTVVTEREAGRGGGDRESRLPDTDALVTDVQGLCLMVLSADCVPVLLYEPCRRVIAAVHAGWRGTAGKIAWETVRVMRERFDCRPEEIYAGIGPSIGPCCFEVGEEVAAVFRRAFPEGTGLVRPGKAAGKWTVDLWEANRSALASAGVRADRIEVAGLCSKCSGEKFFSYRREGLEAGRFGAGIVLCEEEESRRFRRLI